MTDASVPLRGEIWLAELNPARGHEQAGVRPALVVSTDLFNRGPAGIVVILPITSRDRRLSWHVPADPPEDGLRERSFIKCEDVRSVAKERLTRRWGMVSDRTLAAVADRLRILLQL